jgi:hypothetical protein
VCDVEQHSTHTVCTELVVGVAALHIHAKGQAGSGANRGVLGARHCVRLKAARLKAVRPNLVGVRAAT